MSTPNTVSCCKEEMGTDMNTAKSKTISIHLTTCRNGSTLEGSGWEIRELAMGMLQGCKHIAPLVFRNAGPDCFRCKEKNCPEKNVK